MQHTQEVPFGGLRWPLRLVMAGLLLLSLAACASLGASGPTASRLRGAADETVGTANIQIVPVTEGVARRVLSASRVELFSEALADVPAEGTIIGPGDVLEIAIWEAPPALLFGSTTAFGVSESGGIQPTGSVGARENSIPGIMVDSDGYVRVPFAGSVMAAGRTPRQIERDIASRLARKAHQPQVAVRIAHNASANVMLVGDFTTNMQVPLTPKGERLLDAVASAGGVKNPIDKTTIRITRDHRVVTLPLETVIRDPAQNVRLRANDVITAISQSFSFTALGETGTTAEIPFESTGITLVQALGRAGGLKSDRADVRGVFVFRLEDPAAIDSATAATARQTADGRLPVVYVVDLKNPASLFVAQSFPIRDGDVLYVSRAPLTDLQTFVQMIASMAFPILNVTQFAR